MSFDKILFDSLVIRGAPKAGSSIRVQVYTIPHMKNFENLLGAKWYIRAAGDFCYITPAIEEFYLQDRKGKVDYQVESDGTILQVHFGKGCQLVFKFVLSDGTLAQWSDIIGLCSA